jgi:tryptophanyl-tRNA synthetase
MTQFKEKSQKLGGNISVGLFDYPVLMAADILVYGADFVPIGADQKQHLELARNIVDRFNMIYGNVLKMPEPFIGKAGAKICSLQDPTHKMSKSDDNPKSYISMLDEPNVIMKKIKSAVTDSDACVKYADGKDGINNLMTIYSCCTGKTFEEIEKEFEGKGYGDFKLAVGEAVADTLNPIKTAYDEIIKDKKALEVLYKQGAEKAEYVARKTYFKAMKKVGFVL